MESCDHQGRMEVNQDEETKIMLDETVRSDALSKHYQDESNEYRCDQLLMNTLDFSNTYYSMDEFIRVLDYFRKGRLFSQIILKAVVSFPFVVTMCTPEMMTRDFVRQLINRNVFCFNFMDMAYYNNDRDILLDIIGPTSQCQIMDKISEDLQNDKSFIIEAINRNYKCFFYLNDKMKSDRDVVLSVVSKDGYLLGDIDKKYTMDKQIVMAAVKTTNSAIMFASSKLKEDRDFFKDYIIPFNPFLFKHAHIVLRNDCNYISKLIVNYPQCIQYAGSNVRGDVDFILDLIKINPQVVTYVNWEELLSTQYYIKKILQQSLPYSVICSIYDSLDNEYVLDSFVMLSIQRDPKTLQLFTSHRGCLKVVEKAIELNGLALEYADLSIKLEKEIVRKACRQNPNAFKFASPILRQDLDFVSEMITFHPCVILHACLNPKIQKDLIAKTLVQYPKLLRDIYW